MDLITSIMLIGNYFAKHGKIESEYGVLLFFTMIKLPFYTISIYYTFLTYRELKALYMENILGFAAQFLNRAPNNQEPGPAQEPRPQGNQPPPFSGIGYRLN